MFCRQCEQTQKGTGCDSIGICGKTQDTSGLQDLLVHALKSLSIYGHRASELGIRDKDAERLVIEGLFTTVTNVNFDDNRIVDLVHRANDAKEALKKSFLEAYENKNQKPFDQTLPQIADWAPVNSTEDLKNQVEQAGILAETNIDEDIRSLRELLLYGLKGTAAYVDHALILGKEDEEVSAFFYKALSALTDDSLSVEDLVGLNMELGKVNLRSLELLDAANTEHFGHPVPTEASLGIKPGPAIIVTGHDLLDLEELLKQTEGKGINIYTHGEMLPAHGYPELNKYEHLVGHFGGAWQDQQKEFDNIPAAILFTTNCIQKPRDSYKDNVFTAGLVGWPGIKHITSNKDFSDLIQKSIDLGGFQEENEDKKIMVGFGHNAVLGVADKVIDAVKSGAIKHFFLIGGCDGAKPGRNYYTEFAQKVPEDCVILTLACGKFRFNKLDFGEIGGIPRLLDCGQCNDAYSAIKIATALAGAFDCGVNDLPLSLILSWYEQKAVCILLTLLSLGIKNIKIGPSLPAFLSENVLNLLVENFNIAPISTPDKDLESILGKGAEV